MSDQTGEHVHFVGDGRCQRDVFIDGQLASHVLWCDTKAGIAVVADSPLKSTDGETVDFHPVWGEIKVFATGGYIQGKRTFRFGEGPIL